MVDRIYRSLLNNFYPTDIQQIIPFIGLKIVGTEMNDLDTERTWYQNQDATPQVPKHRDKKLELFVQTLGSLHNQIIKSLNPRQSQYLIEKSPFMLNSLCFILLNKH